MQAALNVFFVVIGIPAMILFWMVMVPSLEKFTNQDCRKKMGHKEDEAP